MTVNCSQQLTATFRLLWACCLFIVATCLPLIDAHADATLVAVASNFKPAMSQLIIDFEERHDHTVTASYASSGKLFAQIVNGAPHDLFLSADAVRPTQLAAQGHANGDTQFTYAVGKLIAWHPAQHPHDTLEALMSDESHGFIAIANPKLAPYGKAAKQVLEKLNLWSRLQNRLVRGENIAQAMHFVASGNADVGLVALSQVNLLANSKDSEFYSVPENWHEAILQDAIVIRPGPAVNAFVTYLQSHEARAIITRSGYALP